MRSLHFVHSFSTLTETFIYDYIVNLQKYIPDTHVMTFNRVNEESRPFEPVYQVKLPLLSTGRILKKAKAIFQGKPFETSAWPIYRKKLKEQISHLQPDVIHAHFGPMGVLLGPVSSDLNIPLVVTFYGYDISEYEKSSYWRNEYKNLADTVDGITVLSEHMKENALSLGFKEADTKVVHLGTNLNTITNKVSSSAHIRRFVSVGRLSQKKGHLDTIEAIRRVIKRTNFPLQLDIIGDGEDKNMISDYIEKNNLQDIVHLLGKKPHREVMNSLHKYDAFILCSKTAANGDKEGTPTVLIEAQAAGLPCISTFHSGIPEIFPEQNHDLLSPEGNTEEISKCIQKLISETQEEVQIRCDRGRERVERAFNISKEVLKFKSLYESLIDSGDT